MKNFLINEESIRKYLTNYVRRDAQLEMIDKINSAIVDQNKIEIIEAGTGIGKSMSYLFPSLHYVMKSHEEFKPNIIISTNNIVLQNQIYNKDLPMAINIVKDHIRSSGETFMNNISHKILFGIDNYICADLLQKPDIATDGKTTEYEKDIFTLNKKLQKYHLKKNVTWEELGLKDSPLKQFMSCSKGECKKCQVSGCHFKIRKDLMKTTDVTVINHSLLFSHFLKYSKNPNYSSGIDDAIVILDEAHKIEDVLLELNHQKMDIENIIKWIDGFVPRKDGKLTYFNSVIRLLIDNGAILEEKVSVIYKLIETLKTNAASIYQMCKNSQIIYKDQQCLQKNNIYTFVSSLKKICGLLITSLQNPENEDFQISDLPDEKERRTLYFATMKISELYKFTDLFLIQNSSDIRYLQATGGEKKRHTLGYNNLVTSATELSAFFSTARCVIFLSATLSTQGNFNYFKDLLGMRNKSCYEKFLISSQIHKSPFDYKNNMKVLLKTCDQTNDIQEIEHYLSQERKEGALLLFTSFKEMNNYHEHIRDFIKKNKLKHTLLVQGVDNRQDILKKSTEENCVIIANASFWEGIDLKGDLLKFLYINKLPFDNPSDIFIEKKMQMLKDKGENPFMSFFINRALMKYKQGFGRLIRTETDSGIVLLCDHRVVSKAYGELFVKETPSKVLQFNNFDEYKAILGI